MSYTIQAAENHLTGMGHGSTLNKVRNRYALYERAANTMLTKINPITTMRTAALSQAIHSDVYNYTLPSDYKKIVDLIPQDDRTYLDDANRVLARDFDVKKAIKDKVISIESSEGTKYLRADWSSNGRKTLHNMNSLTANGTWTVVGSAANLEIDTLYKKSGSGSVKFDVVATGDGIQITDITDVDLSNLDEKGELFVDVYIPDASLVTSLTLIWGNDLTVNYWTGVAQTAQADGTTFKNGWNIVRVPWNTAIETGTVDPTAIDALKFTVTGSAQTGIRVDNITASLGRLFDIKYYSAYFFTNVTGSWITQPTSQSDHVMADELSLNIFLYESLILMAQQMEGEDSAFDINFAKSELIELYALYRTEYPSQTKKSVGSWTSPPRFKK